MYVRSVQFSGQLNKMLLSVDRFCVVLRKEPRELTVKGKRNEKKILHQRLSADMASSFYFSLPVSTIIFSSQDNFLKEEEEKNLDWDFKKINCVESGLCYNQMQSFSHSPQKPFSSLPVYFLSFLYFFFVCEVKEQK